MLSGFKNRFWHVNNFFRANLFSKIKSVEIRRELASTFPRNSLMAQSYYANSPISCTGISEICDVDGSFFKFAVKTKVMHTEIKFSSPDQMETGSREVTQSHSFLFTPPTIVRLTIGVFSTN